MRRELENVQWTCSAASEPSLVPPIAGDLMRPGSTNQLGVIECLTL